jgi:hypothetical protein
MDAIEVVGLEWLGSLLLFLGFILLVRFLDHRERMAMIDRGLTPPAHGRILAPRPGSAALRGGLITMMVGLAATLGLYTLGYLLPAPFSAVPGKFGPWLLPGLIPMAVGAALVASHYLVAPRVEPSNGATSAPEVPGEDDAHEHAGGVAPRARGAAEGAAGRPAGWRLVDGSTNADERNVDERGEASGA